jgi:hypothetical protein
MIRTAAILALALALAGCETMLSSRVACTVDGSEAIFVTRAGILGTAAPIDPRDAEVICARQTLNSILR